MPEIFISYRREDSSGHAGRLFDCVRERFGDESVFMDITDIRPGADFTTVLSSALSSCRIVLVVIGTQWLNATNASGRRRLDDPGDHLRLEIVQALARNAHVIPVLVRGASIPRESDLPEDLRPLARRQALEISDTRWSFDTDQLIRIIEADLGATGSGAGVHASRSGAGAGTGGAVARPRGTLRFWIAASVAVLLLLLAARQWWGGGERGGSTRSQPSDPGSATQRGTQATQTGTQAGGSLSASQDDVRLPATGEVRAGSATFKVLGGLVSRETATPRTVRLFVRTTNVAARYGLNISRESFRLIANGRATPPQEAPIEVVSMQSASDGWVVFQMPPDMAAVELQVGDVRQETARIPLDLSAGIVSPADKPAPRWKYPVDLAFAVEKRIGGVIYHVSGARLEHFGDAVPPLQPERLLLTFRMRIENVGAQGGYPLSGDDYRLLVDDVPLAPMKTPLGLVAYQADAEGDVVFAMPGTTTRAILQVGNLDAATAKIPIDLSAAH